MAILKGTEFELVQDPYDFGFDGEQAQILKVTVRIDNENPRRDLRRTVVEATDRKPWDDGDIDGTRYHVSIASEDGQPQEFYFDSTEALLQFSKIFKQQ